MGLTLFGVFRLKIFRGDSSPWLIDYTYPHTRAGWAVVLIFFGFNLTGFAAFLAKKIFKWNSKKIRLIRWVHRLISYGMYGLTTYTIYTGIDEHIDYLKGEGTLEDHNYGLKIYNDWERICVFQMFLSIFIIVIGEGIYRYNSMSEDLNITPKLKELIDEETLERRVRSGEKLVVLDDMVLDIGAFSYHHPGGQFLLDYNIGRDVSKFFYGSYALDGNNSKPGQPNERHAHTNIARKWANNLAVAALVRKNTQTNFFYIDNEQTVNINGFTKTFAFVAKLLNKDGKFVPTEKGIVGIQNWYGNLSELGKCYTIAAFGVDGHTPYKTKTFGGNIMRRHYTITNCLRRPFY